MLRFLLIGKAKTIRSKYWYYVTLENGGAKGDDELRLADNIVGCLTHSQNIYLLYHPHFYCHSRGRKLPDRLVTGPTDSFSLLPPVEHHLTAELIVE